jgi:hypothetical protein
MNTRSRTFTVHGGLAAAAALLALALCGSGHAAPAPTFEPQGLKAEWTFAEGSGTQAADSSGNLVTGTLTNGAAWTLGKIGTAAALDGANDYVALPANLSAAQNVSAATVAGWVNLSSLPASGSFREVVSLSVNAAGPTNTSRIAFAVKGNGTSADLFAGARSTDAEAQQSATATTASLGIGIWYHVAAVYDFAGDSIRIYRNGILLVAQAVAFSATATPNTPSTNSALGAQDRGDSNFFHGGLDEFRIYSRALSTPEIERLATGDGLKAEWKLDEGTGTTAVDSAGNAYDGTLRNGPVWSSGQMGSALAFDGANDYIDLGVNTSILRNVNAATVSAWIKPASTIPSGSFREIVSISVNGASPTAVSRVALALRGDGTAGDIFAGGRSTDTEPQKNLTDDSSLNVGEWVHVAGVIDFVAKTITILKNGVQTATVSAPFLQTHTPNTVSTNSAIGAQDDGSSNSFHGDMDDVRVYCRALSAHEIQTLVMRDCLMAHWKFDEGAGTAASDSSGNGITATLAGGAAWGAGQFGQAVSLDGVNDHVALPANLAMLRKSAGATLACWVNLTTLPASGAFRELISISVNDPAGPTNVSRAALAVKGDGTAADLFAGGRSTETEPQQTLTDTAANIPANTFTHVAAVLDFAGDSIKIYKNGILSAQALVNFSQPTTPDTLSTNGALGAQDKGDSNFLAGLLDEVRVYCRPLSSAEIQALATVAVPPTPTGLAAAPGDMKVTLTWNASSGATSYNVYQRLQGSGSFGPAIANTPQTTFTVMGLTNGVTYEFAVSAVNAAGESDLTAPVPATPNPTGQPPAKPVILTPSKKTNDTTPDITGTADPNVLVHVSFTRNGTTDTFTVTADITGNWTATPSPRVDGIYTVKAKAERAGLFSVDSDPITVEVDTFVSPPTGVVATGLNGQVHVTWTASPDSDVIGYEVFRKVDTEPDSAFAKRHTGFVVGTFFCDDQVMNEIRYCYRIRAVNNTLQEAP